MTNIIFFFVASLFGLFAIILCDCPENSIPWQKQCFSFLNISCGFADAELSCNKIHGHLASIHDGFTNALIAQEATNNFSDSTVTDFWIGATNLMTQKQWNWTDGTLLDFNDWKKGEPQNTSGSGCAAISLADGYWSAQDCFKQKPYVCSTSSTPIYPKNANCSSGWSYFPPTHSCYGVNWLGFASNWTAAETYCEDSNAHLPSIHSYAELQYITSYVYASWSDFWIGISSTDSGRTWKGSDGLEVDFLKYGNWCIGHPSNITGERCIAIGAENDIGPCYYDNDCTTVIRRTL